jgi:hypothetical protein
LRGEGGAEKGREVQNLGEGPLAGHDTKVDEWRKGERQWDCGRDCAGVFGCPGGGRGAAGAGGNTFGFAGVCGPGDDRDDKEGVCSLDAKNVAEIFRAACVWGNESDRYMEGKLRGEGLLGVCDEEVLRGRLDKEEALENVRDVPERKNGGYGLRDRRGNISELKGAGRDGNFGGRSSVRLRPVERCKEGVVGVLGGPPAFALTDRGVHVEMRGRGGGSKNVIDWQRPSVQQWVRVGEAVFERAERRQVSSC